MSDDEDRIGSPARVRLDYAVPVPERPAGLYGVTIAASLAALFLALGMAGSTAYVLGVLLNAPRAAAPAAVLVGVVTFAAFVSLTVSGHRRRQRDRDVYERRMGQPIALPTAEAVAVPLEPSPLVDAVVTGTAIFARAAGRATGRLKRRLRPKAT